MLLDLASHGMPVDLNRLFGRPAPVIAEIGCGSGYFLSEFARSNAEWNVLAADLHSSSMLRTYNRIRQAELSNVRLYHGEGYFLLRNVVTERALSRLYVNFPDPWPKERHAAKRLLDRGFFRLLAGRLDDTGRGYLTTDHQDYFRWALEQARCSRCFTVEEKIPPPVVLKSRYARKWQSAGQTIHHAEFRKTTHLSVQPTLSTVAMQHAILEGSLPDLTAFESIVHSFDDNHVVIKRVLQPLTRRTVFFEVHLEEEGLVQDVLLRVRSREQGSRHVLGVDSFGRPLATRGVAEAVRILTDWFASRGLTVIERSY